MMHKLDASQKKIEDSKIGSQKIIGKQFLEVIVFGIYYRQSKKSV